MEIPVPHLIDPPLLGKQPLVARANFSSLRLAAEDTGLRHGSVQHL